MYFLLFIVSENFRTLEFRICFGFRASGFGFPFLKQANFYM
jgi:hypothetical protein